MCDMAILQQGFPPTAFNLQVFIDFSTFLPSLLHILQNGE